MREREDVMGAERDLMKKQVKQVKAETGTLATGVKRIEDKKMKGLITFEDGTERGTGVTEKEEASMIIGGMRETQTEAVTGTTTEIEITTETDIETTTERIEKDTGNKGGQTVELIVPKGTNCFK